MARFKRFRRSIPLPFLGVVFGRCWIRQAVALLPQDTLILTGVTMNDVFDIACIATGFVIAVLSIRVPSRTFLDSLPAIGTVLLLLSTASLLTAAKLTDAPGGQGIAPLLFGAFGGIGFISLTISWISFFATLNPVRAVLAFCLAQIFGELLTFVLAGFIPSYSMGSLFILPLLSFLCLRKGLSHERRDPIEPKAESHPFPWKPAAFMLVYSFSATVASECLYEPMTYPLSFVLLIPPILFASVIIFDPKHMDLSRVYAIVCPVMTGAFLLPALIPGFPGIVSGICASVAFRMAVIIEFLIAVELTYRLGISTVWLYGIVSSFRYLGVVAGTLLVRSQGIGPATTMANDIPLLILLAVAIVIATLMLMTENRINSNWGLEARLSSTSHGKDGKGNPHPEDPVAMTIAHVAGLYGLTAREEEILGLLVKGRSSGQIAQDMMLATGTVKAHVSHIYQKMDVHNRKELLAHLRIRP